MTQEDQHPHQSEPRDGVWVLEGTDLAAVAGAVAAALDINLHEHHSPMVGPWYSDADPETIAAALEAVRTGSATSQPSMRTRAVLTANDPEPGVVPVEVPGGGAFVLRLTLHPAAFDEVEARLREADTAPRRVG